MYICMYVYVRVYVNVLVYISNNNVYSLLGHAN